MLTPKNMDALERIIIDQDNHMACVDVIDSTSISSDDITLPVFDQFIHTEVPGMTKRPVTVHKRRKTKQQRKQKTKRKISAKSRKRNRR